MSSADNDRAYAHTTGYGCFFRSLGVLLVLFLACGTGVGGCYFVRQRQYQAELATAVARIRSSGEPLDGAELNNFYQVRGDAEDRTALYARAISPFADNSPYHKSTGTLPVVGNNQQDPPPPGQDWAELPLVEQFFAGHAAIADALHEAGAESGSVRYPVDFRVGVNTPLPYAQQVRGAARFLDLEARVRMHRGDHSGATESLICELRMGESLSEEPTLVSQLVHAAVFSMFVQRLQEFLAWRQADDADLAKLQAAVAEVDLPRSFVRAMQGERAICYQTMMTEDVQTLEQMQGGSDLQWLPLRQSVASMRPGDAARLLDMLTERVDAAKEPFPQAFDQAAAAEKRLLQFVADDQGRLPWDRHLLVQMLLPATSRIVNVTSERTGMQCAALAAIAIERYRLSKGELPEKLDQLLPDFLPAVPLDPGDGQPLRYLVTEKGYAVYSVGPDKMDDGGLIGTGNNRGRDFGLRVER
jgi:hypothetical protein